MHQSSSLLLNLLQRIRVLGKELAPRRRQFSAQFGLDGFQDDVLFTFEALALGPTQPRTRELLLDRSETSRRIGVRQIPETDLLGFSVDGSNPTLQSLQLLVDGVELSETVRAHFTGELLQVAIRRPSFR